MRWTIVAVLTAVLTAGAVKVLGSGTAFDKYIRYVCALLLTLGILRPLKTLLEGEISLPEFSVSGEEVGQAVPEAFLRNFEYQTEKAVEEALLAQFSLDGTECRVVAKAEDKDGLPKLKSVTVSLYTLKGAALTGQIRRYLEGELGCEIAIREEIG